MSDPYALRAEDIQTPYKNIADMFFQQVGKFGDRVVLREKVDGRWTEISWNKLGDDVNRFAFGLRELGVEPKDVVAIISNNRSQWVIADYGTLTAGAFLVGVYVTLPSHDVKYILENSEAKVMIVENQEQLDKVLAVFDQLPNLKKIVLIEGEKPAGNDNVITFDELLALGDGKDPSELFDIWGSTTHDDIVTLVYTSGTTGPPKGAILTHGSVLWILESGTKVIDMSGVDETLSFLPLCHVFERVGGLWAAFYVGGIINFAESIDKLMDNMGEVRPTVFLSVPRMLEKAYGKIHSNLEKASPVKRAMFNWALSVGRETMPTRLARKPLSGLSKLKFSLAQALVLGKVKERFGGRMRFIVSGGAPLAKEIAEFFMAMDIWVLEGLCFFEDTATSEIYTF
ncbi:AMP-binding protein, partial [bacterium]|nr:AMP-binding protein [bacterium]